MLLTPEEAREQFCPLMRYCANEEAVVQDGRSAIYYQTRCIGPDCKMGWRWHRENEPLTAGEMRTAGMATGLARALKPRAFVRGYCGFAGRPE